MKTLAPSFFAQRRAASGSAPGPSQPGADQAEEFRRLILPHVDGAYNVARYLMRDAALSEDAVQDAVLRAFRAFPEFRGGSPRAWLFAIVRNCCRTAQARGGAVALVVHEGDLSEDEAARMGERPDDRPNPEEMALRNDDARRVRSAIEAIPEPFREAVVLRELEELSYAEVAQVTGVPIGTVMSRLARGRAMLANALLPDSRTADEQSRSAK